MPGGGFFFKLRKCKKLKFSTDKLYFPQKFLKETLSAVLKSLPKNSKKAEVLLTVWKYFKKSFPKIYIASECFHYKLKCFSDNPAENFWPDCGKGISHRSKNIKKILLSQYNNFSQNVPMDTVKAVLSTVPKHQNTLTKDRRNSMPANDEKENNSSEELILVKICL